MHPHDEPTPAPDGLGRGALVVLALWAATDVAFGATVLAQGAAPSLWLPLFGLTVFVLALNVWLAGLVIGLVAIQRSRPRRLLRASGFLLLLVAAVAASFVLGGWSLGGGQEPDDTGEMTHLTARGLAIWAVAALVVLGSSRLLPGGRVGRPRLPRGRRQQAIAGASLLSAAALAALPVWVHLAARPSVRAINDSARAVRVQLCPAQDCTGAVTSIAPHAAKRILLPPSADGAPDSLRVTTSDAVLGCVLLDRDLPGARHLEVGLSLADPAAC